MQFHIHLRSILLNIFVNTSITLLAMVNVISVQVIYVIDKLAADHMITINPVCTENMSHPPHKLIHFFCVYKVFIKLKTASFDWPTMTRVDGHIKIRPNPPRGS